MLRRATSVFLCFYVAQDMWASKLLPRCLLAEIAVCRIDEIARSLFKLIKVSSSSFLELFTPSLNFLLLQMIHVIVTLPRPFTLILIFTFVSGET